MHNRLIIFLAAGSTLFTGCVSATEEQSMTEIVNFYGGRVEFKKGVNYSTKADDSSGKFLEINFNSPGLGRHFTELSLPASNCAYLAYHRLMPSERDKYDYYRVVLNDSATAHIYTFQTTELAQASRVYQMTDTLLINLQLHRYLHTIQACNPVAFTGATPDTLLAVFTRLPHYLAPFKTYTLQGFETTTEKIGRQRFHLTAVVATIPSAGQLPTHQLTMLLNPQMKSTEKFLFGIHVKY